MGANEKLQSAMHGGEYIPSTEVVRENYGWTGHDSYVESNREVKKAEFDRWLAKAKAEAWDRGAFDAALSLNHGGHNADNPYKEQP